MVSVELDVTVAIKVVLGDKGSCQLKMCFTKKIVKKILFSG